MQAQQAWFVVAAIFNIPNLPMVAPYIAIKTEPTGLSLTDVFAKAKSLINFIADYIPKLVKGFLDGFALRIF